jgi:hypothetical protein
MVSTGCDSDRAISIDCTRSGASVAEDQANARLIAAAPAMHQALAKLLDRYVGLVECGDCGNWDAEKEAEVIEARAALALSRGGPQL